MRFKGEILILIGSLLLMFSSIITFGFNFEDDLENIIFFRGVLLGSLFVYIGGGIIVKNKTIKNIMISLGGGIISLIIASSLNLFFDELIELNFYYYIAIISVAISLIIITLIKLWYNQEHQYTAKFYELSQS